MTIPIKDVDLTGTPKVNGVALSVVINDLIAAAVASNVIKTTVADQAARFALTVGDVQNGDYVFQTDTSILYEVIDQTNLASELGYVALATVTSAQISDATAAGKDMLTAADVDAQIALWTTALKADLDLLYGVATGSNFSISGDIGGYRLFAGGGSASAPSLLPYNGDSSVGFFSDTAGELGIAVGATDVGFFDAYGLTINNVINSYSFSGQGGGGAANAPAFSTDGYATGMYGAGTELGFTMGGVRQGGFSGGGGYFDAYAYRSSNGSGSFPAYALGDWQTGMFSLGSGYLDFSVGGARVGGFNYSGTGYFDAARFVTAYGDVAFPSFAIYDGYGFSHGMYSQGSGYLDFTVGGYRVGGFTPGGTWEVPGDFYCAGHYFGSLFDGSGGNVYQSQYAVEASQTGLVFDGSAYSNTSDLFNGNLGWVAYANYAYSVMNGGTPVTASDLFNGNAGYVAEADAAYYGLSNIYDFFAVTQPAAIADATDAASAISQLNLALAALRTYGIIAT